MKYTITIEETVSDTFEVEANSIKEATEKAIQNYNEAIFVLEPGNVTATHMQAVSEDEKEDSDWFEFWLLKDTLGLEYNLSPMCDII